MKKTYVLIALSSFAFAFACAAQPANDSQAPAQAARGMQQMQGRMEDMQLLMDRIHKTENPQERQRLLRGHMQSMQQGMMMMGQMMRAPGDAPAQPQACAQGDAECRMQRMQGQQQMMMEQMLGQMTRRDADEPAANPENHDAHH